MLHIRQLPAFTPLLNMLQGLQRGRTQRNKGKEPHSWHRYTLPASAAVQLAPGVSYSLARLSPRQLGPSPSVYTPTDAQSIALPARGEHRGSRLCSLFGCKPTVWYGQQPVVSAEAARGWLTFVVVQPCTCKCNPLPAAQPLTCKQNARQQWSGPQALAAAALDVLQKGQPGALLQACRGLLAAGLGRRRLAQRCRPGTMQRGR